MFQFVALLSCVVLVLAGIINPRDDRVLGGQAAVGQFPYQVYTRKRTRGEHDCGGSIITHRHILTAAHCLDQNSVNELIVVVGATHLSFGGQVYELENAIIHSGFSPERHENDIAILTTASDIIFNDFVKPIPLQTTEVPDGAQMVASGWGYTTWPTTRIPDNLQWVILTNMNINKCAESAQPNPIFPTQICTYSTPEHGVCAGDSGGPVVYNGHLAGIVSYGIISKTEVCSQGYPDIHTKVASYVPWIYDFIMNNEK